MAETSLGAAELRFAELIWANAPVSSGELVGLANEAFGWKKSTTDTVLRRLCEKGLFENDGGTVRALLSREDYLARGAVCAVEWSENVEGAFYGDEIKVIFEKTGENSRLIRIEGE